MNVRKNQPIQYRIEVVHRLPSGATMRNVTNYGFPFEPTALKVKVTANTIANGITRTIKGAEFISYDAERIGR